MDRHDTPIYTSPLVPFIPAASVVPVSATWAHIAGPEASTHGAAWSAFLAQWVTSQEARRMLHPLDIRERWLWFLSGWLAKVKQREGFGK